LSGCAFGGEDKGTTEATIEAGSQIVVDMKTNGKSFPEAVDNVDRFDVAG